MTILVGSLNFAGPFDSSDGLRDDYGFYVLLGEQNGEYEAIELGETQSIRTYLEQHVTLHDIAISFAVYYTDQHSSNEISKLRSSLAQEFGISDEAIAA